MKNKTRELFGAHISSNWILYIAYAIASIFIWSYIIVLWTKDKPKEVVTVWVMSYGCDSSALASSLEETKADYLKHVRVNYVDILDTYVNIKYQGLGSDCDIVIVPESYIEKMGVQGQYIALDKEYLSNTIGELEYYDVLEKSYGIKVFDVNDTDDGLIKFTKEDSEIENYYLFINKKSLHMGALNDSSMDGGIEVLRRLLKDGII